MDTQDAKERLKAEASIVDQVTAFATSLGLRCAIQLGLPDIISDHDAPVTLPDLVSQLSIPKDRTSQLYRLMRLLVHNGVFAIQKDGNGHDGYVVTSISKALSNNSPGNFNEMVLLMTDPFVMTPCLRTADWFRSDSRSSFEAVHGMGIYKYYGLHGDLNTKFNAAIGSTSHWVMQAMMNDLKPMLEGAKTLVDVGGGNGAVAKVISEAAPHLKCTVYDLEQVTSNAKDTDGVTFVAGNMFESVPSADIILIKSVLIDWSNEESLKILTQSREAISRNESGGKVIVVDSVIDATASDSEWQKSQSCMDFFTLNVLTGTVRTEMEWKKLFLDAGFKSYKITPSFGYNSIMEVFP